MAVRHLFAPSLLATASSSGTSSITRPGFFIQQFIRPILSSPIAIPISVRIGIPAILSGLWESVLRAVPKKKTSHMKKRSRFLAGKALNDVTALNKCSACGTVKRAHLLCPFCVNGMSSDYFDYQSGHGLTVGFQKSEICGEENQALRRMWMGKRR